MSYLLHNASIATMSKAINAPYGLIENGAIAIHDNKILWAGDLDSCPQEYQNSEKHDMGGRLVTPALIDCHTHIVHGGNRAVEFEQRLNGASYEDIAKAGGGILSTVTATRAASEDELVASALPYVDALLAEGTCVVEIKSGYGLSIDDELKMLRAARKLESLRDIRIEKTFLAAHAIPPEYKDRADDYIDEVCLPALRLGHDAGLIDAVDGFCETIAFTPAQIARVFDLAKELGLPVKLHAEQLSNLGGAKMATAYCALSVDHLEYLDSDGVAAMKTSGSVAVLLPGAYYTLQETQPPPVAAFRNSGVPMALATDCNPGSSPLSSLLMAMNMGCTLFRMKPEEALAGVTRCAAMALGLSDCGVIEAGKRADLAIWDVEHPAELSYRTGFNPLYKRVFGGNL